MSPIILTINRQAKSLAVNFAGDATANALPPLYPDLQSFQIQIVDPPVGFNGANTVVDCSAYTLRAIVAASVSGTDPTVLLAATYEAGWTWDAGLLAFTGSIDLRTTDIQMLMGAGAKCACILELNLSGVVIYGAIAGQSNMSIYAKGDTGTPYVPVSTPLVGGALQIKTGVGGLTLAANVITVTGLGYGSTPSRYDLKVITPAGSGFIDASFIIGSGSATGFQAVLSAIPSNDNYFLIFIPVARKSNL